MDGEPSAEHKGPQSVRTGLSDWEPKQGLTETGEDQALVVRMSDVAASEQVRELPFHNRLQGQVLPPIVTFFIGANSTVGIAVFGLAIIEMFLPSTHTPIVTDKVVIALIGGLTVQVGAVIIAAFKGLFAK